MISPTAKVHHADEPNFLDPPEISGGRKVKHGAAEGSLKFESLPRLQLVHITCHLATNRVNLQLSRVHV
jgi:hypothetical protein